MSDPTWGNHFNIFGDAGLECGKYRYFDAKTVGLDFEGMIADLDSVPKGSVIVLHGRMVFFLPLSFLSASSSFKNIKAVSKSVGPWHY